MEPFLQRNNSDGKTEFLTETEVCDIDQMLSLQNALNLSDHQKYLILNKHFPPLNDRIEYPHKVIHGCNRSCKFDYMLDNFVYSKAKDRVYCIYCALFLTEEKRNNLNFFVNVG